MPVGPYRNKCRALDVTAVIGMAVLLGLPSLTYPFGKDQAEYACTADAALNGKIPYKDVFCIKPPMTPAVHAASLLLFGRSMASIRIFDLIWQAATAVVILIIAR